MVRLLDQSVRARSNASDIGRPTDTIQGPEAVAASPYTRSTPSASNERNGRSTPRRLGPGSRVPGGGGSAPRLDRITPSVVAIATTAPGGTATTPNTSSRRCGSRSITAATVRAMFLASSPSSLPRSRKLNEPDQTTAASSGTTNRRIARTSCRRSGRAAKRPRTVFTLSCGPRCRIEGTGLRESGGAKDTAIAAPAGASIRRRVVAAVRQPVVEPEREPAPDDLGLGELLQRRMNPESAALDAA